METHEAWKKAIRHILGSRKPANNDNGCRVAGPHEKPTLTVAADDDNIIRLCLHHAKIWSGSDQCGDFAATGHTDSLRVLPDWISSENTTA